MSRRLLKIPISEDQRDRINSILDGHGVGSRWTTIADDGRLMVDAVLEAEGWGACGAPVAR